MSPRFKKAVDNLGLIPRDLKLLEIDEFRRAANTDKQMVKIRYNFHRETLMGLLNDVIKERNRIRIDQIIAKAKQSMNGE